MFDYNSIRISLHVNLNTKPKLTMDRINNGNELDVF